MKTSIYLSTAIVLIIFSAILFIGGCRREPLGDMEKINDNTDTYISSMVIESSSYSGNIENYIGIEKVTVKLGNIRTTLTDKNGYFSFSDITPGEYELVFYKEGYVKEYVKINKDNFKSGIPDILLTPLSNPMIVDKNGGTFIQDKLTIYIPPNAVSQTTELRVTQMPIYRNDYDSNRLPIFSINGEPDGIIFNEPITIGFAIPKSIVLSDSLGLLIKKFNEDLFKWEDNDASWIIRNDSIIIKIKHFTFYAVLGNEEIIEWDWGEREGADRGWEPVGGWLAEEAELFWGVGCSGKVAQNFPGKTGKKQVHVSLPKLPLSPLEASVVSKEEPTQDVASGPVTIPNCECCEMYGVCEKQKLERQLHYRKCKYINEVISNCDPVYGITTAQKFHYRYRYTRAVCSHNNIPECHNQGSGG